MHRMGGNGQIAALDFVKALRPRFDPRQAMFDGKINRLIITCLEMQIGNIDIGTPIAAIKRIITNEIKCAADNVAVIFGHHQKHAVGHGFAKLGKHLMCQIGTAPFPVDGGHIKSEKSVNMILGDCRTGQPKHGNAGLGNRGTLFTDIFALA